jgi:hypothetical protein
MDSDYLQLGPYRGASRRRFSLVERPRVPSYRVGEPFLAGRSCWPTGAQYSFGAEGHQLVLFERAVRPGRVEDVRRGVAEFALLGASPVFLLAYRLGEATGWNALPYGWHLQHPESRAVPASTLSPEHRALLWISLVGADDGLIHAQRGVALCPSFTCALHQAIQAQAMGRFNPLECVLAASELLHAGPNLSRRIGAARVRSLANS